MDSKLWAYHECLARDFLIHEKEVQGMIYQRNRAVQYADTFWDKANPNYIEFPVDCTNFVSQCLYAGGLPMHYTETRERGWWYKGKHQNREMWSYSWAVAHSLQLYLLSSYRGTAVSQVQQLEPGDIISYDWDGDGRFQHSAFVTTRNAQGIPLVNAHTYNAIHKLWDYRDSGAWTPQTTYLFIKIANQV
jgi:hypothetical protein